jgi:hypothetical protein
LLEHHYYFFDDTYIFTLIGFAQPQVVKQNFQPNLEKNGGIILTAVTQPKGKILLCRYLRFVDKDKRINRVRLKSDRTLDTIFNPQNELIQHLLQSLFKMMEGFWLKDTSLNLMESMSVR